MTTSTKTETEFIVELLLWVKAEDSVAAETIGKGFASFARKEMPKITAAVVSEVRQT